MNTRFAMMPLSQFGSQPWLMNRASLPFAAGIDDDLGIDREQERVLSFVLLVRVALVRLLVADPIAEILDHGRTLADPAQREHAVAVHGGMTDFDHRLAAVADCSWGP